MLTKIDKMLRTTVLVTSAVLVLIKLAEGNQEKKETMREGFQTEEFDDIW